MIEKKKPCLPYYLFIAEERLVEFIVTKSIKAVKCKRLCAGLRVFGSKYKEIDEDAKNLTIEK